MSHRDREILKWKYFAIVIGGRRVYRPAQLNDNLYETTLDKLAMISLPADRDQSSIVHPTSPSVRLLFPDTFPDHAFLSSLCHASIPKLRMRQFCVIMHPQRGGRLVFSQPMKREKTDGKFSQEHTLRTFFTFCEPFPSAIRTGCLYLQTRSLTKNSQTLLVHERTASPK